MQRNWRVVGLFAFAIAVWGLNYPFVKLGVTFAPPLWFAVLRVVAGLLVMVALLFVLKIQGTLTRKQVATAFLLGVPGQGVFFGFWTLAATQVQPGLVSVFIYTFPLWTLFLSIPVLRYVPSSGMVGAAILGFFGVALTSQLGFVRVPVSELGAIAELLTAGFCFALMSVGSKRFFKGDQLIRATAWQLTGALVTLTLWAGLTTPVQGIEWNLSLLLALLWVGGIGTGLVLAVFFTLMVRYSAASLSAYFFLVVVVALVSSFFVFGETVNLTQAVGVVAIIVAIYFVGHSDRPDGRGAGSVGAEHDADPVSHARQTPRNGFIGGEQRTRENFRRKSLETQGSY